MSKYPKWFCAVLWIGIVVNFLVGVPAIFLPNTTLRLFHQRASGDIVWASYAALLAVILAIVYIAPARDPYRYKHTAKMAVVSHGLEAFFFLLFYPGEYPCFGWIALVYCIILWILLYLTLRQPVPEWTPAAQA